MGRFQLVNSTIESEGETPFCCDPTPEFVAAFFRLPTWQSDTLSMRDVWLGLGDRSALAEAIQSNPRYRKKWADLAREYSFITQLSQGWPPPLFTDTLLDSVSLNLGLIVGLEFLTDGGVFLLTADGRLSPAEFHETFGMSHIDYIDQEVQRQAELLTYVDQALHSPMHAFEVRMARDDCVETVTIEARSAAQAANVAKRKYHTTVLEVL